MAKYWTNIGPPHPFNKMQRALDEYIIEGVKTTIPFHQKLMRHDRFRSGDFTTKFLEEETV